MSQRRYLKPSWLVSRVVNPLLMRSGAVPTLKVRGRKTGNWRSVPVNILELDGKRPPEPAIAGLVCSEQHKSFLYARKSTDAEFLESRILIYISVYPLE